MLRLLFLLSLSWPATRAVAPQQQRLRGEGAGDSKGAVPQQHPSGDGEVAEGAAPLSGHDALQFLYRHLPPVDREGPAALSSEYLYDNVELALRARRATAWAYDVPWALFLNDVLPHASLDEPRDGWRRLMHARLGALVAGAPTLADAAQTLNREIWRIWGIQFKPGQTPAIMSPTQVIAAGYASCTGLSIFLVDACRSVGIPARVAGTPDWRVPPEDQDGGARGGRQDRRERRDERDVRDGEPELHNHNWVEFWDGQAWSFMGAAEYDPRGLNRTWFFPQPAQQQVPGERLHAIYAASYKPACTSFPLAWDLSCTWVNAEDVTRTYLDAAVPAAGER